MDKKIVILIVAGVLCIIAAVLVLAYQKNSLERELNGENDIYEEDPEPEPKPEPEPEVEYINLKPEPDPEPGSITEDNEG